MFPMRGSKAPKAHTKVPWKHAHLLTSTTGAWRLGCVGGDHAKDDPILFWCPKERLDLQRRSTTPFTTFRRIFFRKSFAHEVSYVYAKKSRRSGAWFAHGTRVSARPSALPSQREQPSFRKNDFFLLSNHPRGSPRLKPAPCPRPNQTHKRQTAQ